MNFHHQLHIITIMQKLLHISQFTNMSGKLHTLGIDTRHLRLPKFNSKGKVKTFVCKVKKLI